jgi:hypothetical protein
MFKVELLEVDKKRVKTFEVNTMIEVLEIYGDTGKKEFFNVYQNDFLLFTDKEIKISYSRYWNQKYNEVKAN